MDHRAIFSELICQKGDTLELNQDMQNYLEHDALYLVKQCVRENGQGLEYRSLIQEGLIAAARAMLCYDPTQYSAAVSTYIWVAVENCIRMEKRRLMSKKAQSRRRDVSYETIDLVYEPDYMDDFIEKQDQMRQFENIIRDPDSGLDDIERQVIQLIRQGYTQQEIGKILGTCQSQVSKHKTSAIEKIRMRLEEDRREWRCNF